MVAARAVVAGVSLLPKAKVVLAALEGQQTAPDWKVAPALLVLVAVAVAGGALRAARELPVAVLAGLRELP
jgi:hypothetical protein